MMKRLLLLLVLGLGITTEVDAQNFWLQTAGPGAGSISTFGKGKNGLILASAGQTVFRTSNTGSSWTQSSQSFNFVTPTVFGTNSQGWIYTVSDEGIYVSKDQGVSWAETDSRPGDFNTPRALTIGSGDAIFVGTDNSDSHGVWVSEDGGATWDSLPNGSPVLPAVGGYYSVGGLAAAPDGTIYMCSGGGVYRLPSGSDTWVLAGFGGQTLAPGRVDTNVLSIAVSKSGKVYAVTATSGLYSSTNKGASWKRISGTAAISEEAGQAVATDDNKGVIFATAHSGVFISLDDGGTWKLSHAGSDDRVQTVAGSGDAAVFYIGSLNSGISYSTNKGTTWVPRNNGIFNANVTAMCGDTKGNVFANVPLNSVFSTNDFGDAWNTKGDALSGKDIRGLTATSSDSLFASSYGTESSDGIFRSGDHGETWSNLVLSMVGTYKTKITTLMASPGGALFAGGDNGVVYISLDNGSNWLNSGKPIRAGITTATITAMAWAKQEHIFAANADGIWRNTDYGNTSGHWDTLSTSPKNVTSMVVDISNTPNIIYAASSDGIFSSNDDGETWKQLGSITNPTGIAINSKGVIYAIGSNGTYSSHDQGANWVKESDQLNSLAPTLLFVDRKDVLYAGTAANGVYRSPEFPHEGVATRPDRPSIISFENNYPNPFFSSTTVRYTLNEPASVKIDLLDMTGKFITTLNSGFQNDGSHYVVLDAAALSLPSGVYHCRLSANGESLIQSVIYIAR